MTKCQVSKGGGGGRRKAESRWKYKVIQEERIQLSRYYLNEKQLTKRSAERKTKDDKYSYAANLGHGRENLKITSKKER